MREDALKLLKEKSYFKEGESTWEDICRRVSKGIAIAEKDEIVRKSVESRLYSIMAEMKFIFSTPVLLNADAENPGQLSSCFTLQVKDDITNIFDVNTEFAKIFQKNGGAGTDLSAIRPAKSCVNSSRGYAGGPVSFMEVYDNVADMMTRNNPSRKGAVKINLRDFHPDIFDFIHAKDDLNKLNRMNISVSLSDSFMNAVRNDENWTLRFPDFENYKEVYDKEWDGDIEKWESKSYPVKIYKTIKAKELLNEIAKAAWKTGEPGLNCQSTMDRDNPNKHINTLVVTNP